VETQVRVYRVRKGQLARFVEEWNASVRPLREHFGFRILSAWASEEDDRFAWVLAYDEEDGFAAADARYYGSDERAALDPDPARLLEATEHFMAEPLV
jgi:NIPSNAP protein